MEPLPEPMSTVWPFPFVPQDWEHTPTTVQAYVHTLPDELMQLRERVEALEARLKENSTTSHRPPSSDSPSKKPRQRTTATTPRSPTTWAQNRIFVPHLASAACPGGAKPRCTLQRASTACCSWALGL